MNLIRGNNEKIKLSILPLSIILSFCVGSTASAANIIADERAPSSKQADIQIERQNLPVPCQIKVGCGETAVINIQTPDKNGLSHNKYTQFDAPHYNDRVIINNALSSDINGNPYLQSETAKIILNEVRSDKASILAGSVKLAGQDAHVIIANPSGIDCNGCSFTDMYHLTLTTGAPSFSDSHKLQKFEVREGNININKGEEVDTGLMHKGSRNKPAYLDLFADKVNIKGKLTADDVFIIAGKYSIDLASPGEKMNIRQMTAFSGAPNYFTSVDVGDMGGMYANKIRIRADGNIKNSKEISATGLLQIVAGGNIYKANTANMHGATIELLPDSYEKSHWYYPGVNKWSQVSLVEKSKQIKKAGRI